MDVNSSWRISDIVISFTSKGAFHFYFLWQIFTLFNCICDTSLNLFPLPSFKIQLYFLSLWVYLRNFVFFFFRFMVHEIQFCWWLQICGHDNDNDFGDNGEGGGDAKFCTVLALGSPLQSVLIALCLISSWFSCF